MMEEVDLADTPLAMRPHLQAQDSVTSVEDEAPDPRIQVELERLNTSTDLINKLEVDLDEARMKFRQTLLESTQQIDSLTKKLGKCVEQARPYYEARIKAKQALTETQKSAVRYERAVSQHAAAREMVQLAEEGLLARGCVFDSTWQEMLNHATTKVNDAEKEKIESTSEHKEKSNKYHESETRVKFLQKELKRAIAKSSLNARRSLLQLSNIIRMQELQLLPYFELKAAVNQRLEEQKRHVRELEVAVASAKTNYAQALTNLETISDQIHKTRQTLIDLGIRGVGVGAESPGPPFCPKIETIVKKSSSGNSTAKSAVEKVQKEKTASGTTTTTTTITTTTTRSEQRIPPIPNTSCVSASAVSATSFPQLFPATTIDISTKESLMEVSDNSKLPDEESSLSSKEEVPPLQSLATMGKTGEESVGEVLSQPLPRSGEEVVPPVGEALPAANAGEPHSSYLSGWQFVALPSLHPSTNQSLLSIEDRDSIVSDSESLTSMEMLSEEAIANLMLEDEINEATQSICSHHFSEEYLAPPGPKGSGALSQIPLPSGGLSNMGEEEEGVQESSKKEIKNASQASSSDSGEPWEVVNDPTTEGFGGGKGDSDPSIEEGVASGGAKPKGELRDTVRMAASDSKLIMDDRPPVSVGTTNSWAESPNKVPVVKVATPSKFLTGFVKNPVAMEVSTETSVATEMSTRPQSLAISSSYPKSSSSVSSSSTSNSISEEFSPSYAPLSDTPDMETTTGSSQLETTPGSTGNPSQQPAD